MASGALTLVHVNDVHRYLEPHPGLVWHGSEARFLFLVAMLALLVTWMGYAASARWCC